MPRPQKGIDQAEFIRVYKDLQSSKAVAEHFGCSVANVCQRRRYLESQGVVLPQFDTRPAYARAEIDNSRAVYKMSLGDGQVLIGSDFHVWPGERTTMQRAFIHFAKSRKLLPNLVGCILNGDVFDGASISRHPSIGWEKKPTVRQEMEAVQDFLGDLLKGLPAGCLKVWVPGNHCLRFESRIAANVPEFAGVQGVHLKDHFPEWETGWRVDINDDVVVKHRGQGGEHADFNNAVKGGKTIVTGHDHRANVTAYHDYRGTRWGVRCGYMGESPLDEQFVHYLEASAPNWCPAFVVLTFRQGKLLWPELVTKHADGEVNWRGQVISV